ncbi:MAG: GH1 family beta-glucosidase [bacterium]|nr:GH1 family beta-glucosidase [bacterium]
MSFDNSKRSDFGPHFTWGVSSSALQSEGAHNTDGKGPTIWDEFSDKQQVKNKDTHYQSGLFYEHYKKDIDLIKSLYIPNFRFSISWSRILPEGTGAINERGIQFYHNIIDYCLVQGIEPWVTLYHWDLPLMLEKKGGWTNREILNWFQEYVQVCCQYFGHKVKYWMVLNEPLVFTGAGYFAGVHAPSKKGLKNFLPAAHHAVLAQALGFKIIKKEFPSAQVGTTFSCSHLTAQSNKEIHILATKRIDTLLNRMFVEPSLGLGYPIADLPVLAKINKYMLPGDEELMKVDFDFIGLQVYTREVIKYNFFTPFLKAKIVPASKRKVHHTKMDWEVFPDSIYEVVKKFSQYQNVKKIIITENGASFHDELVGGAIADHQRVNYLKKHIEKLAHAQKDFPKLQGYFVWSLTDNFEWAEGYEQRFGLIYIDYETLQRTVKDSGYWYSNFLNQLKQE